MVTGTGMGMGMGMGLRGHDTRYMMHGMIIPDTWRIQFDLGIVIAMHSRGVKISATLNQRMLPVSHVSSVDV
jgi:hypothetical protein